MCHIFNSTQLAIFLGRNLIATGLRFLCTLVARFAQFFYTNGMIICPAQPFDISQIMNIERQSFIPAIQEKKRVFERRLKIFPEGFLVLADASPEVVFKNKTALVCGYLCAELWDYIPDFSIFDSENLAETETDKKQREKEQKSALKKIEKRFELGHNPLHTHKTNGTFLYVSSFALLKEYRGKGSGEKFFKNAVAALVSARNEIKKIVILVNSDWKNALAIYEKLGFKKEFVFKGFFPTIQKKESSDGLVMTVDASIFREIEFSGSENEFGGIKI